MKLPKVYEPQEYEGDIYDLWEKSAAFAPKHRGSTKNYSVVIPPPNANGNLHIGHALTLAVEDIAVRYHRMKGEATLFLPGADHAGFETQAVYEKHLAKKGKSRFDFTRDELYSQIWDFVAENRQNYQSQFRRFGASLNWSNFTFTLDKPIVDRAHHTFKKMWDEGLIYRGERLVNFCTFHGTAFADIEVEFKEVKGHLWDIAYPLTDGSGEIIVATTRPETMLGDTAVAVHPDDVRYENFVGKTIKLPLTNREIPIITDEMVDQKFGSGAVKITPAHDQNDYDVARRHDLPFITVITHEGKMGHNVPEQYIGLSVKDARKRIIKDLQAKGYLKNTTDYTHSVGHCYKCGTILQPLLRDQWFVDMQPLAKKAIKALKEDKITFYPDAKKTQLITYLEGLRDWNISRQIAWGIPIPAFQNVDDSDDWIYNDKVDQETITVGEKTYRRDPDVFDTWFSSSSWPYATLDYPDGKDFEQFYPLSLMETGGEILYPWVSRMIMLGLYITGEIPFKEVYIHGYVMATDGTKMSKSIGNVVNPVPVIDKYGSDALRMGIIAGRVPAVNRGYDERRVEEARNFCNKLWNIARFIEDIVGDDYQLKKDVKAQTPADNWILSKLSQLVDSSSKMLNEYRFAEVYENIYHFVWDDLADWYIETSKTSPNKGLLVICLEAVLKITHPFAPFVTETIWQTLAWEEGSILAISTWPKKLPAFDKKLVSTFEDVQTIVTEARFIQSSMNIHKTTLIHHNDSFIVEQAALIKQLGQLGEVTAAKKGQGIALTQTAHKSWLKISDQDLKRFVTTLKQSVNEQTIVVDKLKNRLSNKSYISNAPGAIIDQTKQQLSEAELALQKQQQEYEKFSS